MVAIDDGIVVLIAGAEKPWNSSSTPPGQKAEDLLAVYVEHRTAAGTAFYAEYARVLPSVTVGEAVVRGEKIGVVGYYANTANGVTFNGGHVHFGITMSAPPAGGLPGDVRCGQSPASFGYTDPLAFLRANQPMGSGFWRGWIVQWNADPKPQLTAWLVSPEGKRNWIPDIPTFNCLISQGVPGPVRLPSSTLGQLADQKDVPVKGTCGQLNDQIPTPSTGAPLPTLGNPPQQTRPTLATIPLTVPRTAPQPTPSATAPQSPSATSPTLPAPAPVIASFDAIVSGPTVQAVASISWAGGSDPITCTFLVDGASVLSQQCGVTPSYTNSYGLARGSMTPTRFRRGRPPPPDVAVRSSRCSSLSQQCSLAWFDLQGRLVWRSHRSGAVLEVCGIEVGVSLEQVLRAGDPLARS